MTRPQSTLLGRLTRRAVTVVGALALTLLFFLVLPVIQTITKPADDRYLLRDVQAAVLPPPPTPDIQDPVEEEPEPEDPPPELAEEAPLLDLSQLELALDPSLGEGFLAGDFTVDLRSITGGEEEVDALFSLADLDQEPRAVYQPSPAVSAKLRKKMPGTVYVLFEVDQRGRVHNPIVQKSTDPVFERPALAAVKQWRFEPGRRNGEPVRFRIRIPITFR